MSPVSLPLLATFAFVGALVMLMVDGRRAVPFAALAAALALAPTAAVVAGPAGGLELLLVAALAILAGALARLLGRQLPRVDGIDPVVPLYTPRHALFGPRAVRAAGAAILLPAASWVSFNIPVGAEATVSGLLFPAAYVTLCATLRIFVARTVEDLTVGVAALGIAVGTAWLLRTGAAGEVEALLPAMFAPLCALVAGWLGGRHARRLRVAA